MLVLSRKAFETIKIGKDIVVTILHVSGNQVKIGIDAPPSVTILRHDAVNKGPK